MQTYGLSAWRYLGQQIKTARKQAGYRDSKEWAEKVGRSTRILLGLERGETVGDDTLERIELALEWPVGRCEALLASRPHRPDLDLMLSDSVGATDDASYVAHDPEPTGEDKLVTEGRLREEINRVRDELADIIRKELRDR